MPTGKTSDIFRREGSGNGGKYYDLVSNTGAVDVALYRKTKSGSFDPLKAPPTTPVVASTRFGACAPSGNTSAQVVAKYGPKTFIRYFAGNPTLTAPTKTTGASGMHISWSWGIKVNSSLTGTAKTNLISANNAMAVAVARGDYDAQITASVTGLDPTYFYVEALHELDTKYNGGWLTLANGQAMKNHFYNVVKAANPALYVVMTLQGYGFANSNTVYTSGVFESRYGGISHDIIGLDVDGIQPSKDSATPPNYYTPYPVISDRAPNAQKWVTEHNLVGYAFPEWGTTTTCVDDTSNQILANTFITGNANSWKAQPLPPMWAAWYDYGGNPEDPSTTTTDLLTQPAPITALSNLVAGAAATAAA